MALPDRSGRSRSTIVLLVLTAVTLLTLDGRDFGPLETLQDGLRDVVAPVRDAADAVVSPVGNVWNGITDYDAVTAENEALRAEVERLRGQGILDEAALSELEALRAEAGLDVDDYETLLVEVVGGQVGNFEQFFVEIDAGADDGIVEDMAVVTSGGFVGRVSRVGGGRSQITLASDPDFVIGVSVAGGVVVARGTGDPSVLRVDTNLNKIDEVAVDDIVLTRSSLVPPDLPVGRVASIERDDDGTITGVEIELSADLDNLEFVSVVLVDPAVIDADRTGVLGDGDLAPTTTVPTAGATTTTTAGDPGTTSTVPAGDAGSDP